MKNIEFIKMNGLGNDFVIMDARVQDIEKKDKLAKKVGDRHLGIGCDQVIFLEPSDKADAFMRIYNADGSESGACGNATRCVADILLRETEKNECVIETKGGLLKGVRADEFHITVDMGEPKLEWHQIPLSRECDTFSMPVGGHGVSNPVGVNMGNPHCVFFVDDLNQIDVSKIGPKLEYDPLFPERANIEFVEVLNKGHVRMRVWERGSGITLACGTGSCATAVAAIRRGLTARKVIVEMDGGPLMLEWKESDNHVYMTGPVTYVFKGQLI